MEEMLHIEEDLYSKAPKSAGKELFSKEVLEALGNMTLNELCSLLHTTTDALTEDSECNDL